MARVWERFTETGRRVQMFLRRKQSDRDMDEEMRLHRDLKERELATDGHTADEAHYPAARRASRGDPMVALRHEWYAVAETRLFMLILFASFATCGTVPP
jgi:hypothetical protein